MLVVIDLNSEGLQTKANLSSKIGNFFSYFLLKHIIYGGLWRTREKAFPENA